MAQPSLDILHSIPKIEQNRGTAMPEIVVTDRAQIVLFQQLLKFLRNEVWLQEHTHIVYTNKVHIIPDIAAPAELHLSELMGSQTAQIIVGIRTKRKGAAAIGGFCSIVTNGADDAITDFLFYHCSCNVYPARLEIDVRPSKPQCLRSTQTVKAGKENGNSDGFVLRKREQLNDFLYTIGFVGLVMDFGRPGCQVCRIVTNVLMLQGPL